MKKPSKFYYGAKTYGELNNIKMNWFRIYIKVLLPFRIILSALYFFSFLGNLHNRYMVTGTSQLTGLVFLIILFNIISFFILCYTYTKMKNLEENGYQSNIVYLTTGLISISFTYMSITHNSLQLLIALILFSFYIIICFFHNFFFLQKKNNIFVICFGFNYQDVKKEDKVESINYSKAVYNDFDIFWSCPSCGRQNQSIKCYGCGLTKEEAAKKIKAKNPKQSESPIVETEQKTETNLSTKDVLINEKIEQLWTSIKPEITDKIYQNSKEQASQIIISLSQMLDINIDKCSTTQYIYILSIYCDVFNWKINKKASDKLIISSLQVHRKDYITSERIAKNVLDFCVETISKNGFTIPSNSNENLLNDFKCKNNKYSFCNKCGNKLSDDYAFCNKCGNKVR